MRQAQQTVAIGRAFNVYYRNLNSGRLCRHTAAPMSWETAALMRDTFNSRNSDLLPNPPGTYPFGSAWIDLH